MSSATSDSRPCAEDFAKTPMKMSQRNLVKIQKQTQANSTRERELSDRSLVESLPLPFPLWFVSRGRSSSSQAYFVRVDSCDFVDRLRFPAE